MAIVLCRSLSGVLFAVYQERLRPSGLRVSPYCRWELPEVAFCRRQAVNYCNAAEKNTVRCCQFMPMYNWAVSIMCNWLENCITFVTFSSGHFLHCNHGLNWIVNLADLLRTQSQLNAVPLLFVGQIMYKQWLWISNIDVFLWNFLVSSGQLPFHPS